MESLLLFRRALSSPTMCRFIPALSVPSSTTAFVVPKKTARRLGFSACYNWEQGLKSLREK